MINIWMFYLIDLLQRIKNVMTITIFILVISILYVFYEVIEFECGYNAEHNYNLILKTFNKLKKIIKMVIILTTLLVIITSEETMNKMWISSYVTEENAQIVIENIDKAVDYIIEKIN